MTCALKSAGGQGWSQGLGSGRAPAWGAEEGWGILARDLCSSLSFVPATSCSTLRSLQRGGKGVLQEMDLGQPRDVLAQRQATLTQRKCSWKETKLPQLPLEIALFNMQSAGVFR